MATTPRGCHYTPWCCARPWRAWGRAGVWLCGKAFEGPGWGSRLSGVKAVVAWDPWPPPPDCPSDVPEPWRNPREGMTFAAGPASAWGFMWCSVWRWWEDVVSVVEPSLSTRPYRGHPHPEITASTNDTTPHAHPQSCNVTHTLLLRIYVKNWQSDLWSWKKGKSV